MKVFVTGGTGFIGSHVIKCLLEQELEVSALRLPGCAPQISLPKQSVWVDGNLESDLTSYLKQVEVLIHLAAHGVDPRLDCWTECMRWNFTASLNLWLQAASVGVRRFLIAGSCFEYGLSGEQCEAIPVEAPLLPTSAYGASKAAATIAACALARSKRLELAVLRPFHVFGEGEATHRFFPQLKAAALAGTDFAMSPGEQIRDFTPVEQVARSFVNFAFHPLTPGTPEIHNLGTGKPQSLLHFARYWWTRWNAQGRLLPGALAYRSDEIMRYVPQIARCDDYIPR